MASTLKPPKWLYIWISSWNKCQVPHGTKILWIVVVRLLWVIVREEETNRLWKVWQKKEMKDFCWHLSLGAEAVNQVVVADLMLRSTFRIDGLACLTFLILVRFYPTNHGFDLAPCLLVGAQLLLIRWQIVFVLGCCSFCTLCLTSNTENKNLTWQIFVFILS